MVSYTSVSNTVSLNLSETEVYIHNDFQADMSESISLGSSNLTQVKGEVSIKTSDSYCQLVKASLASSGSDGSNINCTALSLIQKTSITKTAVIGQNGKAINLASSNTITVSFFQNTNQPLNVKSLTSPISIWIPRKSNLKVTPYQTITTASLESVKCVYDDEFLQNGFTLAQPSSIHIQFKPVNTSASIGYMTILKFGSTPKLNSSHSNYDLWRLYCPNDTRKESDDSFYLFFVNTSTVNGFTGYVGFSLRELTPEEMSLYCPNNVNAYNFTTPPVYTPSESSLNQTSSNSTRCKLVANDLNLRVYLSGCYYMDTSTGSYKTDGTEVLADTNIYSTHCQVTHCTEFAGGFIVLPTTINFEDVFANASIEQNPIIYATVITIVCSYALLALLCRFFDVRDGFKKGVTFLNGDRTDNLYEIIVLTGNRRYAGTESKVCMMVTGEDEKSHVLQLRDKKRKLFQRGAVDTFIISTDL